MPPLERRWLEAWAEPCSPTSNATSPRGAWGGEPSSSSSSNSDGSSNGGPHSSDGGCSRRLSTAAVGHGGTGARSSLEGTASTAAGTAAALESWVVHLLQAREAQLTHGTCGQAADAVLRAHVSVITHAPGLRAVGGNASGGRGSGGGGRGGGGVGGVGGGTEGGRPAGHEGAFGLDQWRQLAAVLGCVVQHGRGGPTASGHVEEDVSAAGGPGQEDGDGGWEAVAVTLARLLRCTEAAGGQGGSVGGGGQPLPPLPPLRGCYLRSGHPALRAVLLSYAMLAVGRAREAAGARWGAGGEGHAVGASARADQQQQQGGEHLVEPESDQQLVLCRPITATPPLASPAPPAPAPPPASVGPAPMQQQRRHGDPCPLLVSNSELLSSGLDISSNTLAGGPLTNAGDAEAAWCPRGGRLWVGEGEEDDEGTNQEERVMRLWLNSLAPGVLRVGSLFEPRMSTGWPLLQVGVVGIHRMSLGAPAHGLRV